MTADVVSIRSSILGADRAFKVVDQGGGGGGGGNNAEGRGADCPITALGHADGQYWFLDFTGQARKLSARDLSVRANLVSLFGGKEDWLRKEFPKKKWEWNKETKERVETDIVVDFAVNSAGTWLIERASRMGLYGKSISLRQPGVWRGPDGLPIVHCGDQILVGNTWHPPGFRAGKQIWVAAEATRRPAAPCGPEVARQLQDDLQGAWRYRTPEGAIAVIGMLVAGWLCGALSWRINCFITGESGSGKTALMNVFKGAWPEHQYSNDTSKAGLEQAVTGRAVPSIIDEAADRANGSGRELLDVVLSASGDEGTKQARGTSDGKGRTVEVVSAVAMFSIYPPPLQPQHMGRFLLIELEKPDGGEDHRDWHRRIAEFAQTHGPALWGRAIGAFERYLETMAAFRKALAEAGCSPCEMDSKGALLAGWYVMTNDGLPMARDIREGIAALGTLLVTAVQAEEDGAPQQVIQHLMASHIQLHRSTDRKPVGEMMEAAFSDGMDDQDISNWAAADQLGRYGIRVVRRCYYAGGQSPRDPCECANCLTKTRKRVPRPGQGAGVWVATRYPALDALFMGSDYAERKWLTALARARDALPSGKSIRIGPGYSGHAIWLPVALVQPPEPDS